MKHFLSIVALCTGAAIFYGLVHDQITARVCIEYFTIGHTRMFESDSPTLHALYWGIAATWWAGLASGVIIAAAARVGTWPKLAARQVWPWVAGLLVVMGLYASIAGSAGKSLALAYPDAIRVIVRGKELPDPIRPAYVACRWVHQASYQAGFAGSIVVALVTLGRRWHRSKKPSIITAPDADPA